MAFPSDLRNFKRSEFRNPDLMNVAFLRWLDRVRERAGVPFTITSDARPEQDGSLHARGRAVDLRSRVWSVGQKWRIAEAIFALAGEAPGKVEFEPVPTCNNPRHEPHWHLGVDDRAAAQHELVEVDNL